jgi:hypothetical protein
LDGHGTVAPPEERVDTSEEYLAPDEVARDRAVA